MSKGKVMYKADVRDVISQTLNPEIQRINHALLKINERLIALEPRDVPPTPPVEMTSLISAVGSMMGMTPNTSPPIGLSDPVVDSVENDVNHAYVRELTLKDMEIQQLNDRINDLESTLAFINRTVRNQK